MTRSTILLSLLISTAACGTPSSENSKESPSGGTGGHGYGTGGASTGGSNTGGASTGGSNTGGASTGGSNTGGSVSLGGGNLIGGSSSAGQTAAGGDEGAYDGANGGTSSSGGGQIASGGQEAIQTGGGSGGTSSSCAGPAWPTADPTSAGPFAVMVEKNVGPQAGVVPDPIYGDEQQRFNVYRPQNLTDTGLCHPILIWANGYRDNPEQNPPNCIVDSSSDQWCGQYSPMLNHLASHGFVVVASLSTATAEGDPLPTLAGLDWILEQAEAPASSYYGHLDTKSIGQLGHSYGGMSTCMSASDPRYKALATICGTRELNGVHTPMLFFCGGNDSTVDCQSVKDTYLTVANHPAFFLNELNADHGSWVYEGPAGVSLSSAAAWFRVHLMSDDENRKYFYGEDCEFCTDSRVIAEQNSLMLP